MEGGKQGIVVVFSAFMIQLLALGNLASIGIYTVHFLQEFDNDTVGVSLISSIHVGAMYGLAPLTTMILTKLKYRNLCLVGAILVSSGLFGVHFLPQLNAMYLFLSIFCGVGGLFIYLPSHVLSGLYYDKHRTLSTGIASAGMATGAFVMPLVVGLLIEKYTWKGSFLVLSGIQAHLFIFAMFMIPPVKSKLTSQTQILLNNEKSSQVDTLNIMSDYLGCDVDSRNEEVQSTMTKPVLEAVTSDLQSSEAVHMLDSQQCFEKYIIHTDNIKPVSYQNDERENQSNSPNPEANADITYVSDFLSLLRSQMKSHLEVFKDFECVLYFISTFIWCVVYVFFMTFGPDHIYKQGHSAKTTAFLFTFYGLGQVIGCVVFSAVGNFIGHRVILYSATCVLTGLLMALVPLMQTFSEFALLLTALGFPYGGLLGLSFIVVVDLLGTDKITVGLAYLLLVTGAGCFVGPLLGAYLENVWGTYTYALYLSGGLTVIAGLITLIINRLDGKPNRRLADHSTQTLTKKCPLHEPSEDSILATSP